MRSLTAYAIAGQRAAREGSNETPNQMSGNGYKAFMAGRFMRDHGDIFLVKSTSTYNLRIETFKGLYFVRFDPETVQVASCTRLGGDVI